MNVSDESGQLWLDKHDILWLLGFAHDAAHTAIYSAIGGQMNQADQLFEFLHEMQVADYTLFEDGLELESYIVYEFFDTTTDGYNESDMLDFLDKCDPNRELNARATIYVILRNKYAENPTLIPAIKYHAYFSYDDLVRIKEKKTGLILPDSM